MIKPSVITKKITVNSFQGGTRGTTAEKSLDLSRAERSFNFDFSSGNLQTGIGVSIFKNYYEENVSDLTFLKLYTYIRYDPTRNAYVESVIYYASDNMLYEASVKGLSYKKISTVTFGVAPSVIPYTYLDNDVLLLSEKNGSLYIYDGKTLSVVDGAPPITSLCIHSERIFATGGVEGRSLWFSDDFDPTNWSVSLTEGGFINFTGDEGRLLKAVSFLGYVYVFREYGILRVIADGDQQNFSVDNLYGMHGKIYGDSVTLCGDFIVMVTSLGIYTFNGLNAVKILSEYDEFLNGISNEDCKGCYDGAKLYLSLNINIDGEIQKVILVYDLKKKSSYIAKGLNVSDLTFFGGSVNKTLCVLNNGAKTLYFSNGGNTVDGHLLSVWESAYLDFSFSQRIKNFKKIAINSLKTAKVTVKTPSKSRTYKLKSGLNEFYPCIRGEKFKIIISSSENSANISNLTVWIDAVKESK